MDVCVSSRDLRTILYSGNNCCFYRDLTNNPINCDCALRWLPRFLSSSQFTETLLGACSSPPSLSSVEIVDLTEEQLVCGILEHQHHNVSYLTDFWLQIAPKSV